MSELSPLSGAKQTSRRKAATSGLGNPKRTCQAEFQLLPLQHTRATLIRHLTFVPARLIFGKSYESILLSEAMGPL
jgi:hypothetical protein